MLKILIITNSSEISFSLAKYLNYSNFFDSEVSVYTFDDLHVLPREILELDFVITEAYRLSDNSIDDYGVDIFLSFLKMGKNGMLLYFDRIQNSELGIKELLFKIPGMMRQLTGKMENVNSRDKVILREEDIEKLRDCFPYRVSKDHHR